MAGFTLFVAMIVSSLLLAVGFSISNIILKQLLLSGSGKDSQIAFYAADSGAECAQFWDARDGNGVDLIADGPFATSTATTDFTIKCGRGVVDFSKSTSMTVPGLVTSTLVVDYSTSDYKACALVLIEKGFTKIDEEDVPYTKVVSRGYNSSLITAGTTKACDLSNKRTVERGLVVQY